MNEQFKRLAEIVKYADARVAAYADIIAKRYSLQPTRYVLTGGKLLSIGPEDLTETEKQVFAQMNRDAHIARMDLEFYVAGYRDGARGKEPSEKWKSFGGAVQWGNLYREGYAQGKADQ